jgi:hypothetical protein
MRRTPLKKISDKKQAQLPDEIEIRRQLCERAGGLFVTDGKIFRCLGGWCELCGHRPDWRGLHPHEKKFRSQLGKLSLENSVMACGKCHSGEHLIEEKDTKPMWSDKKIKIGGENE